MSGPAAPRRQPPTDARRRAVALALARRPGLDLDALHGVLTRLDVTVDRAVLVEDLAALGVAVAADGRSLRVPAHGATGGAPWPDGPTAHGSGPAPGRAPIDQAPIDRATSGPPGRRARRGAGVVVVLALLTVAAVVVGVLAAGGGDDEPATDPLPPPASAADRGADPTGAAPGVPGLALAGSRLDVALDFAGQADALPPAGGVGWVVGRGTWTVGGDRAQATVDGGSALAWLATPGELEAEVVAPAIGASVGLAVRVVGVDAYVAWVREPTGDVALLRVVGPVREVLARVPGAAAGREAAPLGVRVTATGVEAFVGGVHEASATLAGPLDAGATGLGLVVLDAGPTVTTATFDDLVARFTL
ncbi:MAG TPA: hypothetical protein VEW93_06065 [Acidimicrobiales bacterium]|nr:hypothetical protein [Acidimicrobiales bacterium]